MDNLVKNLVQNEFYHVSEEFEADVLDLTKKKGFFPLNNGVALKNWKRFT